MSALPVSVLDYKKKDEDVVNINVNSSYQFDKVERVRNLRNLDVRWSAPSLSGGSSGTYVANSLVKNAELLVNGSQKVFDLLLEDIREISYLFKGVANPAETALIGPVFNPKDTPEYALPAWKATALSLNLYTDTITNIQSAGGDRTTASDVSKVTKMDWLPKSERGTVIKSSYRTQSYTTTTGEKKVDLLREGQPTHLLLYSDDNGTASDTLYTTVKLLADGEAIIDASWISLKMDAYRKFGVGGNTGFLYIDIPVGFSAEGLKHWELSVYIPTAGTAANLRVAEFRAVPSKAVFGL